MRRISSLFSLPSLVEHRPEHSPPTTGQGQDDSLASPSLLSPPFLSPLSEAGPPSGGPASLAPRRPFTDLDSPVRTRTPSPRATDQRRRWRSRSRGDSTDAPRLGPPHWICTDGQRDAYDVSALVGAQKVCHHPRRSTLHDLIVRQISELWDDHGDTLVYLVAQGRRPATPSFRVHSSLYASSLRLISLADDGQSGAPRRHVSPERATNHLRLTAAESPRMNPTTTTTTTTTTDDDGSSQRSRALTEMDLPAREYHLYFPVSIRSSVHHQHQATAAGQAQSETDRVEELVSIRNLFAFLARQPLVATWHHPTVFATLMTVAHHLRELDFSNLDGSTFGEVPRESLDFYVDRLGLADFRGSREKTLEGLVLAERMRSLDLYREAFAHAVGKYAALTKLGSPLMGLLSAGSRNRMERSHMVLETRLEKVRHHLTDFDFPSIFSGIANSTSYDASKTVHFRTWKSSFNALRKHVIGYYRSRFGSWPPKASSKKNGFEADGLNRLALQVLYHDLTNLYDLLVDRTNLTTREVDVRSHPDHTDHSPELEGADVRALRRVMSEYDRSSPPVQPPIPFDTPRLPTLDSARRPSTPPSPGKADPDRTVKVKDPELEGLLLRSYNQDAIRDVPFLTMFRALELKAGRGRTMNELCDQRNGYWIFVYAVVQSLPLLVVDAPALRYTEGVEYFLCEAVKGGPPWGRTDSSRRNWYGVAGGAGVVSLPADVVEHGVEGTYRRSHCWTAAERWTSQPNLANVEVVGGDGDDEPVAERRSASGEASRSPTPIAHRRRYSSRKSVMGPGLEALPLPDGVDLKLELRSRRASRHDPTRTFADIIADDEVPKQQKKKWGLA